MVVVHHDIINLNSNDDSSASAVNHRNIPENEPLDACASSIIIMETSREETAGAVDSTTDKKRPPEPETNGAKDSPAEPTCKVPKLSRKQRKHAPAFRLRATIQICCKENDLSKALRLYDKAVSEGTRIEAAVYYSLLALCDGVQHGSLHIGRPQYPSSEHKPLSDTNIDAITETTTNSESDSAIEEVSIEDRIRHAFRIKTAMDKAKIPLTEAAYTAVIKLLVRAGDVEKANEVLMESETVQQCRPKLRLYASLLQAYAEAGKAMDAVRIWYHFSKLNIMASEKEYLALMRCAVLCQSPTLMESVLTDLAEDVPVPSRDSEKVIIEWFQSHAAACHGESKIDEAELALLLEKLHAVQSSPMRVISPSMGPVQSPNGWIVSRDCGIKTSTGELLDGCLRGEKLHPIEIAPETWQDMQKASESIGSIGQLEQHESAYRGGGKGSKLLPANKGERERNWKHFLKYLEKRRVPIDIVIDGANVGHNKQNLVGAPPGLQYDPIDWVIQALQELGKSVLIVMHFRHFKPGRVPPEKKAMVDSWFKQKLVYKTPHGMDDDTFWMHAALLSPGRLVLTNDEMRDHHFQMLAPRCFLRWKDRHQVHFEFGEYNAAKRRYDVRFKFPDPYTRRVQRVSDGLVVPLPKLGDKNRFLDGVFVAEDNVPESETYLCIRPQS